jgi:hypothetical protein
MKNFVNLTPHSINIVELGEIPSSGVARLATNQEKVGEINGVPLVVNTFGDIQIPEGVDCSGKIVVVSLIFKDKADELKKLTGAKMIVAPDTSPNGVVRNEKGQIVGVKQLVKLA